MDPKLGFWVDSKICSFLIKPICPRGHSNTSVVYIMYDQRRVKKGLFFEIEQIIMLRGQNMTVSFSFFFLRILFKFYLGGCSGIIS